jgi:hypothetical protein
MVDWTTIIKIFGTMDQVTWNVERYLKIILTLLERKYTHISGRERCSRNKKRGTYHV